MAYTLQPLISILQQILDPEETRWILGCKKPELESLLEKAASLQRILENSSLTEVESMESQIIIAGQKAEDAIESYMVNQLLSIRSRVFNFLVNRMLSRPESVRFSFSKLDLRRVTLELDSATENMAMALSTGSSSSSDLTPDVQQEAEELEAPKLVEVDRKKMVSVSSKNGLVGVDEDLMQLKDRLTNMQSKKLEIIPITGMGGIGKSTLARSLYHDSLIVEHFKYRGWATISQVYNMRAILESLLCGPDGKLSNELIGLSDNELKDVLYRRLFGRRYLIVLDDIWSQQFWDEIRVYFPDCNKGSRIVITTRESNVAKHVNFRSEQHEMQLLNELESWNLLRRGVFGKEKCPRELRKVGTKIASDCCGLPLAIHVIAGLLSKVERTRDAWEHISADVKEALVESDEKISNILSLSYNQLPFHLKPCFLYIGLFPKYYNLKASRLVGMWIAQGFVKPNDNKSLEEEAEDYLKVFVERNLLSVRGRKCDGKPKSYSIHDLLRDLCIRKADDEKYLHVKNSPDDAMCFSERHVSVHSPYEMKYGYASLQLMSLVRSFLCINNWIRFSTYSKLRLVRELHVMEMVFKEFPQEILQLVNLRYLAFNCFSGLPHIGISRLWNLQTLISKQEDSPSTSDLWEIPELRHLRLETYIEIEEEYKMKFVHKKLQTIQYMKITPSLIRSGFFETIPNIIRLGIYYEDLPYYEVDLSHLHKLDILKCRSDLDEDGSRFLPKLRFPCNLRKLTLSNCVIYRSFLTSLCELPSLEVLRIWNCVFESAEADEEWEATEGDEVWEETEGDEEWEETEGDEELPSDEEWEATEGDVEWETIGEFRSLQYLHLVGLNVARWRADETNFPRLQRLFLRRCYELEEIPSAIGDISTLQEIKICKCSASVVGSAQEIEKVQQDEYDNDDLKVIICTTCS